MMLIIIEGQIASGKTTLTKNICSKLNFKPMFEPVETNPYLEKFYKDKERWALEMQFWFLVKRFEMHNEAVKIIYGKLISP